MLARTQLYLLVAGNNADIVVVHTAFTFSIETFSCGKHS